MNSRIQSQGAKPEASRRDPGEKPPTWLLPDLTMPQSDTRTVRRVLSGWLSQLAQSFLRLPLAVLLPSNRALYQATAALYGDLLRRQPNAVALWRWPTLNAPMHCLRKELAKTADQQIDRTAVNAWLREVCSLLLLELGGQGLLPEPLRLGPDAQGQWPVLRSPGLGLLIAANDRTRTIEISNYFFALRGDSASQSVDLTPTAPRMDGPLAHCANPYHEVEPGLYLAETDNNPLSDFEAHPDKQGNRLDLGGRPVAQWLDSIRASLALIDRYLPVLGQEFRLVMRVLVPVGWHDTQHLSASYQEAIGQYYLTLHPNCMTMTEAIIHEFQHNKLNAAFHLDPLLRNAWNPLYTSPVRPDPRPLHGVILAVHAFQPVALLYAQMLEAGDPLAKNAYFLERFRAVLQVNRSGAEVVISHAQPTAVGELFFAEMCQLNDIMADYQEKTAEPQVF